MKNYLKSCSLLFIACLGMLFSGCEKDLYEDAIQPQRGATGKVKYVTIEEVPFLIPSLQKFNPNYQFLSTQNRIDNGTGNANRGISDLNLDLDHIIEYLETNGFKSYSVVILKEFADNEDIFFENLHIVKIGNKYEPFLFKYNADDDAKKFSLSDFTGKLEVSDVNKKYEGTVTYENGQARLIDPAPPTGEGGGGGGDDFDTDLGSGPDGHSWFWHLLHSGVWWGSSEGTNSTGNTGYVLIVTSPVIDPFNNPNDPLGTGNPGSGNGVVIAPNEPQWIYPTSQNMMRNCIAQRLSLNLNYTPDVELKNYIKNTASNDIINEAYFYMYEEENTDEIKSFVKSMFTKIKANPNVFKSMKPFLIEKQINDNLLDPCNKGILNQLKSLQQNDLATVIAKFDNVSNNYQLNFATTPTLTIPLNSAETDWTNNDANGNAIPFDYTINIKTSYKNTATKMALARTLLHEILHAHILSLIDNIQQNVPIANPRDFAIIYQAVLNNTYGVNPNALQHIQMSRKYIEAIRDALKEWDNSLQPLQYYEDLAWGGLTLTSTFDVLYPVGTIDRDRIIATNSAEDTNSTATSGTETKSPRSIPCP